MRRVEQAHGAVSRVELEEAGASPGRIDGLVARGRLVPLALGSFRVAGAPDTIEARTMGAIKAIGRWTWASHHTADRLWTLGVASRERSIEVTRPYGASANRGGVRVHRSTHIPSHHVTQVRGVPVTTVARTLFDLARTTGPGRLDKAIERALRDGKCTIGGLYRVLYDLGGRGRPGTRRLRTVLEERGVDYIPTESELDAVGRAVLASVPGIAWQVQMFDEQGYIRRVDGLLRASSIVIEFDGGPFHREPSDVAHDAACDARLVAAGNVVLRFGWIDLTRRTEIVRATIDRLSAAA